VKSAIEIMLRRADDVARELVERAPAGSILAVFAGGSVGRSEVWARPEGEVLAIHSDIDLYIVITEGADEDAVRDAAARAASATPDIRDGVVFLRGIDAGVYRLPDLLAQPARPGTVDMREHHQWLYGDRAILDALAPAANRSIAATEALYLLENRAWDVLGATAAAEGAGAHDAARARVQAAKAILDVGAAHLISEGRFVPTYLSRMDALRRRVPARLAPPALAAIETAEAVRLGNAPLHTLDARDALVLVADAWCELAPSIIAKPEGASADTDDVPALLATRCARGALLDNYREFIRLRRRARWSLFAAATAGLRFATLSPRAVLRTHALARGLVESARAPAAALAFHADYVGAFAAHLGFDEGRLDSRARAALRAVS
jgi:hypothetical protein